MVMARIYTRCGEYDKAIDELSEVLSHGDVVTTIELQLLDWVAPLRDQPRYIEIIARYRD